MTKWQENFKKMSPNSVIDGDTARCCKKNCLKRVPMEVQVKFKKDYELCTNIEAQSAFINANVRELPVDGKKNKFSRSYFIQQEKICIKSFKEILKISDQKIFRAVNKHREGSYKDNRGGSCTFLRDESRKAIVDHIKSFPRYHSHYRRETSSSMYEEKSCLNCSKYLVLQECV